MRAVFADCHVGRQPGDEGPFLDALRQARDRGAKAISLLGDIFHFFIAHPKFETPAIARFLETVDALREDGVPVTYVEGNRDFFCGRPTSIEVPRGAATRRHSRREIGVFCSPTATS